MPVVVPISTLEDPRLAVYRGMRDSELRHRGDSRQSVLGAAGVFMAEGDLVVERLVQAAMVGVEAGSRNGGEGGRFAVQSVLCTPTRQAAMAGVLARLPESVAVYVVDQATMNGVVGFNMHRGMLAVGEVAKELTPAEVAGSSRLLLVLEDLVNHDNIGSLFRSAAALGGPGTGVLLSPRCADPLYRKSLRVSMGHVLTVPYGRVQPGQWPGALADLKTQGWRVAAMTPAAGAVEIGEFALLAGIGRRVGEAAVAEGEGGGKGGGGGVALVLGTEGEGLSAEAMAIADYRVRIEIAEGVDSLNVGVAGAIALHRLGRPGNNG